VLELELDEQMGSAVEVSEVSLRECAGLVHDTNPLSVGYDPSDKHVVVTTISGLLVTLFQAGKDEWIALSIFPHDSGRFIGGLGDTGSNLVVADRGVRGTVFTLGGSLRISSMFTVNGDSDIFPRRWSDVAWLNGLVYCLDGTRGDVSVFTPSGTFVREFDISELRDRNASAITAHTARGTLFALCDRRIVEFTALGAVVNSFAANATLVGGGLSVDPATGNLVALDAEHRRVLGLSLSGADLGRYSVSPFIPPTSRPQGVALRRTGGNWLITTNDSPQVREFGFVADPSTALVGFVMR
jgi:DNA-binding beta-propeller fold protein YncE